MGIDHLQTVGIAIQRNTQIGTVIFHRLHQRFGVGCADFVVDVETIGRATDGNHFRTQFMKHLGRDVVRRTVCRINHHFHAFERQVMRKSALAKLDVTPCRIVQTARFTQRCRIRPLRSFVQSRFNRRFPVVRQFCALGAEEFNAIIRKRVVAGANHHAQRSTLRPRQIRHTRSRQRPQQHDIHARRVKTAFQRTFQHIARNARIFADQHRRTRFRLLQHTPHRVRQTQHKIRRNGILPYRSANAIGSKVFSGHHFSFNGSLKADCCYSCRCMVAST